MKHKYRITLEHIEDNHGTPLANQTVSFETENHDDIFALMQKTQGKMPFSEATSQAFCVGLKLVGEVLLEHRDNPTFANFAPHFGTFMKSLKRGG